MATHNQRTLAAWHEAGHAIVCAAELGNVTRVSITHDGRGHQAFERLDHASPETITRLLADAEGDAADALRGLALACVRWCLAGRAAESVCTARPTRHLDDDDTRTAVAYCTAAGYGGDVMSVVFWMESTRVRRWLGRHRAHLAAVAGALVARGEIDGDELFELVRGLAPLRPM